MTELSVGSKVYDEDGEVLGRVRGFDDEGFYVSSTSSTGSYDVTHDKIQPEMGEGELMWRCSNCGEVGSIGDLPEECPGCGAPKTDLYYWTED